VPSVRSATIGDVRAAFRAVLERPDSTGHVVAIHTYPSIEAALADVT
jgi:hypothetical protein